MTDQSKVCKRDGSSKLTCVNKIGVKSSVYQLASFHLIMTFAIAIPICRTFIVVKLLLLPQIEFIVTWRAWNCFNNNNLLVTVMTLYVSFWIGTLLIIYAEIRTFPSFLSLLINLSLITVICCCAIFTL